MVTAASPFPHELGSIPAARRWLRSVLADWSLPAATTEDVMLMANELTTNVVLHAGTDYQLKVILDGPRVRVEVSDHSPDSPHANGQWGMAPENDGGRGLAIVETLASRWGSRPTAEGKTVWFELEPSPP